MSPITNRTQRLSSWLLVASIICSQSAHGLSVPAIHNLAATVAPETCLSGFSPCQGFHFPGDFCCPANSSCSVLAGNTTLLCCPDGQSCTIINPITCDLSQQDPSTHPRAPIKTTVLNGVLPKCGLDSCCPFGYDCNENGLCTLGSNQMTGPVQTVPTTTVSRPSTLSKTTTRTPTRPAHTALSSAAHSLTVSAVSIQPTSSIGTRPSSSKTGTISDESAVAHADDSSNGGKSVSVTGGVVGGLMGVLLVGAAIWFLLFRRLRRGSLHSALGRHGIGSSGGSGVQQCRPLHPSPKRSSPASFTSSFGSSVHKPLSISPPRLQSDTAAYRTDFIRKLPSSHESSEPASSACSTVGTADVSHLRAASTVSSLSCSQNSQCEFSPQPSLLPQPLFVTRPSPQKHGSVLVKPIRDMRNSTSRPQHPPRETDVLGTNVVSKMSSSPKAGGPLGASASSENSSGHAKLNEAHDGDSARMTTFTKLLQAAAMEPVIPAASQRAVPASAPPRR